MVALFVAWYNFARKHETLKKQTPAMGSGIVSLAGADCGVGDVLVGPFADFHRIQPVGIALD
jgi:hypothetical protein